MIIGAGYFYNYARIRIFWNVGIVEGSVLHLVRRTSNKSLKSIENIQKFLDIWIICVYIKSPFRNGLLIYKKLFFEK